MSPVIASFLAGRRLFVIIGIVAVLVVAAFSLQLARQHRRLAVLQSELAHARNELAVMSRERDVQAAQLAPFESLAAAQIGSAPYKQRLQPLLERIQALVSTGAGAKGRRHLDAEALERIRATLQDAPDMNVEVGGVLDDPESMLLAKELHSAFDQARFKVYPIAEYVRAPNGSSGVSIYSKHQFDRILGAAVAQIFKELAQPTARGWRRKKSPPRKPASPRRI